MSPREALPHTYARLRLAYDEPAAREVRRLFDAAADVVMTGRRMEEVGMSPGRIDHLMWLIEKLGDVVDPSTTRGEAPGPAPTATLRLIQGGKA